MSKKSEQHKRDRKRHRAKIKNLRTRLKKARESKVKWKARAKRFEAKAKQSDAKAAKRSKQVKELRDDQTPRNTAPDTTTSPATPPITAELPDDSWTVNRLRASAREAEVPGYSRMRKAALLDALKQKSVV